jgi:hypothetical protein
MANDPSIVDLVRKTVADTLAAVHAILDALGPQLTRAKGPKHVASPSMRG